MCIIGFVDSLYKSSANLLISVLTQNFTELTNTAVTYITWSLYVSILLSKLVGLLVTSMIYVYKV